MAKRWVDDNANIPINRIVLYTYSPKRQKYFGESKKKYAIVFEILKEYKKYGMTLQELQDYHEATEHGEIITSDPIDEFFDRPDPIDEFRADTEYFETIKSENPFLSFMTKDFEDVYSETPKKFKKEWELIPIQLIYDSEKKESVLMELPDNVKTREPHEILFQVQTDDSIFNYIKKHKLRFFPTPIERDEDIERVTWDRHIEPIVKDYNLKNSLGDKFEYKYFTHPKTITETEMYLMLRKTMDLCQEFSQDPKDEDRDNFLEKVMGKLKSDISKVRGKDGKKVDLKDMFHTFLVGLFKKTKMRGSREYFHELPVFLALVDWEYAKNNVNKDTGKTNNIQKEAPEQKNKVFPCEPGTKWGDVKITLTGDDTVRVKTLQGEGVFSYHQLELADGRIPSGKATILWTLLKSFAKNNGFISPNTDDYDPKLPDTAKRLNKHLQKLFGIEESIYTDHYKKLKKTAYRSRNLYITRRTNRYEESESERV